MVGYTTQEHLLLDLDDCSWIEAQAVAREVMREYPEVGSCLISQSSENRYHLIFDDKIAWARIEHIIETLAELGLVEQKYLAVRKFRRDLTLRISEKTAIGYYDAPPSPKLILEHPHICNYYSGIRRYLRTLKAFREAEYKLIPKEVIS